MSTRIYCDQCGTETSKRKALRFSLSGYSANRTFEALEARDYIEHVT